MRQNTGSTALIEAAPTPVEDRAERSSALVLTLCLAVAALDGLDVPILGLALPAISQEWGIRSSAFVAPTALGLVGMGVGTGVLGALGDRFGARRLLITSTLLFGLATASLSLANDMATLSLLRLIAGVGLGGALPNALSLIAVSAPPERRIFWLASVGTAMQVGGVAAGILASLVLAPLGWRALMLIGGALPLLLCVALMLLIPERRHAGPQARKTVPTIAATMTVLFAREQRRTTLLFWGSFAVLYSGLYLIPTWLPAVLAGSSLPVELAGLTLAAFNLAGIAGGLLMSIVINRRGIRKPLVVVGMIGAIWALLPIVLLGRTEVQPSLLVAAMGMQGLFAIATLVALVALVSDTYKEEGRGTGVGAALAAARVGAIASAFLGALIVGSADASIFFATVGGSLASCALLCAFLPARRFR